MEVENDFATPLRRAVQDCSERGLAFASKWAAELLHGLHPLRTSQPSSELVIPPSAASSSSSEAALEEAERDILLVARSYADAKEFVRAARLIERSNCSSKKAKFIRLYNQFLADEKKALRDWRKLDFHVHGKNTPQPSRPVNTGLQSLLDELHNETDPWLSFLKAIVLQRMSRREEAIEAIIVSLTTCPWNWSAWLLLIRCLGDANEFAAIVPLLPLPQTHPLVQFFQIKTLIVLHQPQDNELDMCDRLLTRDFFPGSLWVMGLRASVLYCLREFDRASQQFESILAIDPYRIDDIDIYSNILYVAENRTKLSSLAHHFLAIDKDRPEVCCLVGNYYSLRTDQERAIMYFRRATDLDPSYLAAWTLMGHEYIELKNSHAAIEAYRRAIDVDRKDYRAWYGLGQAYELLSMHHYSLHYYQRATALRPYDLRVWQAQAMCYEEMGRPREAIECYKRALIGAEGREISLNLKLGKLYDEIELHQEATSYHQRVIDISQLEKHALHTYAKSLIYVAKYHLDRASSKPPQAPNKGDPVNLELAHEYLEAIANSNAEEVVLAAEMLRKLKTIEAGGTEEGLESTIDGDSKERQSTQASNSQ